MGSFLVFKNGGFNGATLPHRFSRLSRLVRRFRRPAPLLFLLLAGMTLLAGVLYRDDNGDSDSYRIPRVLHWLAQGQWHWIRTMDPLINITNCNFEWLSAPLILFTHTDRTLFLINWISLLLLPGLTFSFLKSLGVRPRVAWWWMWLLASGWCFAFQASSTVNDSFAGVYALAGVVLTLLTLLAAWRLRRQPGGTPGETRPPGRFLRLVPWFLLLVFMAKVGTVQSARHLSPYYILLFPLLLCQPGIARVVRQRWWQITSLSLMLLTLVMVSLIRDRPLFPVLTLSHYLARTFPNSTLPPRIASAFSGGLERDKFLTFLAAKLPADQTKSGYAVFMEAQEPCLWLPWGQRTVMRVLPTDQPADWSAAGVHYIVMESFYLDANNQDLAGWLKQNHGVLLADYVRNAAQKVPPHVYLIKLADNAG